MTGRLSRWLSTHYQMGIARWLLLSFVVGFLLVLGGFLTTAGFAFWSYLHEGSCISWLSLSRYAGNLLTN